MGYTQKGNKEESVNFWGCEGVIAHYLTVRGDSFLSICLTLSLALTITLLVCYPMTPSLLKLYILNFLFVF